MTNSELSWKELKTKSNCHFNAEFVSKKMNRHFTPFHVPPIHICTLQFSLDFRHFINSNINRAQMTCSQITNQQRKNKRTDVSSICLFSLTHNELCAWKWVQWNFKAENIFVKITTTHTHWLTHNSRKMLMTNAHA